MMDDAPGGLLRKIIAALEAAHIPHMVVGSFASTAHGEPRTTRDLDLVIDPRPDQLNELLAALDAEHYYVDSDVAHDALRHRSMFNIIEIATGWKLDLVIRKARPFSIEEMQVYLQRYKSQNADMNKAKEENRVQMWDLFQTCVHEYIHTLAHPTYQTWAQTFATAGDSTRYNTLI
jgi:hypothetical protein